MYNLHEKNFYTTGSLKIELRQDVTENIFQGGKKKNNKIEDK